MPYDALYYPWIDPPQRATLATAMLYWDHLYTITPANQEHPYVHEHSRTACDLGFLRPRKVHSKSDEVITASNEFLNDLDRQAIQVEMSRALNARSRTVKHARLHTEKMSHSLRTALMGKRHHDEGGFYRTEGSVASAYMARLAAVLARTDRTSAYTDWTSGHNVVVDRYADLVPKPSLDSAEATLAILSFSTLHISSHIPLHRVWGFRNAHHNDLVRYRRSLRKAARLVPRDLSLEDMRDECSSLVKDEIRPATDEIGAKLQENGIDFGIAACEAAVLGAWTWERTKDGKSAFTIALGTFALKVGFTICKKRIGKARILRSPFAYLVHAQSRFAEEAVQ